MDRWGNPPRGAEAGREEEALEVTMDDKEIMSALRAALVDRVGTEVYELWFGRVDFQAHLEGLEVRVPDPFTLERLRHKLRGEIAEACQAVWGHQVELRFIQAKAPTSEPGTAASAFQSSAGMASTAEEPMPSTSRAPVRPALATPAIGVVRAPEPPVDELPRRRPATFDTFIAGPSNQLALAAARSAISRLGSASPLLLYGPHGSGKTHLLEGIVSEARRHRRVRRSLHLSAEQFTTQFLEALQGSGLPSFRRKYRDLDLLAIDDIQFLAGKKATLVELQHTLDGLQRAGRQVVLSADRPPSELQTLGSDIVVRLSGGLVCGVEPADESMRRAIVLQAAQRLELALPASVLDYIAAAIPGDARQLFGALNRLDAIARSTGESLTLGSAQQALADLVRGGQRMIRLPDIERAVCQVFGLDTRTLQSDTKSRAVSQPRMLAMWLARKYTRAGLSEIGEFFGRRSHTTVIAAQRKMNVLMSERASIHVDSGECSILDAIRRVENRLRTG